MLQQEEPRDYVIATGHQYSVRTFVEIACKVLGIEVEWRGQDEGSEGVDKATGAVIVRVDARYFRPTEVETLLGDPSDAETRLGWKPKTSFAELVKEMVEEDLVLAQRDQHAKSGGFKAFQSDVGLST